MLVWEALSSRILQTDGTLSGSPGRVYRAKVPGGWLMLIKTETESTTLFYPDPQHEWDGTSMK